MRRHQPADHVLVQRLRKAQISDSCGKPLGIKRVSSFHRFGQTCAKREDRHSLAFAHDAAFTDCQLLRHVGQFNACAIAAWIAERNRTAVVQRGGIGHVDELCLIRRRHHNEIRQRRQIGNVERSGMRAAIRADQPRTVNRKPHRQILDRNIMHNLVIGALQERRIDCTKRAHALRGQSRGEGNAMLFGNANVKGAIRVRGGEFVNAGSAGHRGGDRHNARISVSNFCKRFTKDILIRRRAAARALVLFTSDDIEFHHAMIFVRRRLGWRIAMPLFGDHMDQHRPFGIVAHVF